MKIITASQIDSFKNFIKAHNNFIIVGHKDPDGDCISSSLGVSYILEYLNKPFTIVNNGPFKRPETKEYEKFFTSEIPFMSKQDQDETGLIIVDCSEKMRLGEVGDTENLDTFIIDHHKTSTGSEDSKCIIDSSYTRLFATPYGNMPSNEVINKAIEAAINRLADKNIYMEKIKKLPQLKKSETQKK